MSSKILHTQRLTIRPFKNEDIPAYFLLFDNNREHLKESFPSTVKEIKSIPDLQSFFEEKKINHKMEKEFSNGIFLKKSTAPIGYISIKNIDWKIPKGELSYYIFQKYAKQGYATEALIAFRDWCFQEKKFKRLYVKIISGNKASTRLINKCGFKHEGTLIKDYRTGDDRLVDLEVYGTKQPTKPSGQ